MIRTAIRFALPLAAVFGCAAPAAAQMLTGANVNDILSLAKTIGTASQTSQPNGDPQISGDVGGVAYQVYFRNCFNNQNCEDLNFYAGFADNKQPLENMNAWNRDSYYTEAYLDADLDAIIEMDVNLVNGVTRGNLQWLFRRWATELDRYARYIGYK